VPSWDDAIAVLPGECLALVNPDRQVHVLRAKAPLPPQFRANQPPLLGRAIGTGGAPASSAGLLRGGEPFSFGGAARTIRGFVDLRNDRVATESDLTHG
jgi:hypothetical protein